MVKRRLGAIWRCQIRLVVGIAIVVVDDWRLKIGVVAPKEWRMSVVGVSDVSGRRSSESRVVRDAGGVGEVQRLIHLLEFAKYLDDDLRRRVDAHVQPNQLQHHHSIRPQVRVHESGGKSEANWNWKSGQILPKE